MKVSADISSPNFSPNEIDVQFVILHYTACDLARTKRIFSDPAMKVCAHFVLDTDGTVYDLGGFLKGPILQGAHAGESHMILDGETFTKFNAYSIGIEIINLNGNVFPYTKEQYKALTELLAVLIKRFPILSKPGHIVGHEHIAGHRGKCDPGVEFDWDLILDALEIKKHSLLEGYLCTPEDVKFIKDQIKAVTNPDETFWSKLSSSLESRLKKS